MFLCAVFFVAKNVFTEIKEENDEWDIGSEDIYVEGKFIHRSTSHPQQRFFFLYSKLLHPTAPTAWCITQFWIKVSSHITLHH